MGIVDRVFSRVGATDDLAGGRSTFMVEMSETAQILKNATSKSLVILDEIGRGTATFDGLSIAWAAAEHLHEFNKCRTLFATHYHEMTALGARLRCLKNYTLKVSEMKGDVIFLHEVEKGQADRSYGIQVAKLAGLPDIVVKRARAILEELEQSKRLDMGQFIDELPLFASFDVADEGNSIDPAIERLRKIDPDDLTPKQALSELYELIALAQKD